MAKFYSLFSSSSGNAAYLGNGSAGILFDIGVSCRKLCTALQERELAPNAIQAICITHTHIDHIRGLAVFLKNYPTPVYGTAETLQTLAEQCNQTDLFHTITPEQPEAIAGQWEVTAFSTPVMLVITKKPAATGIKLNRPNFQSKNNSNAIKPIGVAIALAVSGSM